MLPEEAFGIGLGGFVTLASPSMHQDGATTQWVPEAPPVGVRLGLKFYSWHVCPGDTTSGAPNDDGPARVTHRQYALTLMCNIGEIV